MVVKKLDNREDIGRYGVVALAEDGRITDIDEKPLETNLSTVSTGIYVVRRRLLIELLEKAAEEDRYDFVRDILVRYRNIKKIYGYKLVLTGITYLQLIHIIRLIWTSLREMSGITSLSSIRMFILRLKTYHQLSTIMVLMYLTALYQADV